MTFLQNALSWLASNLISRAVSALLFILLTQRVELADTGAYTLGVTFVALLTPLLGWGLEHLFIRDVSPNPQLASSYLMRFIAFRLFWAAIAYLLLVFIVRTIGYAPATQTILLLFGLMLFSEGISELLQAVLVTFDRAPYMLLVIGPLNLLRAGIGVFVLLHDGGSLGLVYVVVGSSMVKALLLSFVIYRQQTGLQSPTQQVKKHGQRLGQQIVEAYPFVLIDLFWAVEYQIGLVFLSILLGEAAAGLYGAAFALLAIMMLFGQAYMMTGFPILSRLYHASKEQFDFTYEKSCLVMVAIGLPVSTATTFRAQEMLTLVFPQSFADAATMLIPLVWTLPLFFLHVPVSRVMILTHQQKWLALFIGIAAFINMALTPLLIQWIGAAGAAWTRLISYSLFFVCNYLYVHLKVYPKNLLLLAWKPVLAAAGMASALFMLHDRHLVVELLLAGTLYLVLLQLLGTFSVGDMTQLWRLFSGASASAGS